MTLKFGKQPHTPDRHDLKFAAYLDETAFPTPPKSFGHENVEPSDGWGMLGNGPDDSVFPGFEVAGDCTVAGGMHSTMLWCAASGKPVPEFTGKQAIGVYSELSGYDPQTGRNDNGLQIRDVLRYRQKTGLPDKHGGRHKIGAYIALDPTNLLHLYVALYLFEIVELGIMFPAYAMGLFDAGKAWTYRSKHTIDGGHDIPLVQKRSTRMDCVTWAQVQAMTRRFYQGFADEAWCILSEEMLNKAGDSTEGFDLARLQADLAAL